jgi:DNA repair protein RadD
MGIYSASIGRKDLGEPITFAGIQSVRSKARELGHIDLVIIDECHLVNHKDEGGYRKLLAELKAINPSLRVIGLTATPYRLGHGLITDKPAMFDDLLTPVSIEELIFKGYLSTLRSKVTKAKLDTTGVKKRGGEFIESELQAAVDTDDQNHAVVREVVALAGDRKAWLFFCAGVQHAQHVAEALRQQGVAAECVTGETPKKERERILTDFKAGRLRAVVNVSVLSVGFDHPDIDLIAMLRPTMSASLYVQMAGRGMRVKSHTDHCLVLDFAGVVETHGPITNVQPPKKSASDGEGEAPVKVCDACGELVHISAMTCPACGAAFPEPVKKAMVLRNDDIMGLEGKELEVTAWAWREHTSKASGKQMLAVTYYGGLSDAPITEYLPILHEGYAGQSAVQKLITIAERAQIVPGGLNVQTMIEMAQNLNNATPPRLVEFRKDGKFFKVTRRKWA